MNMCVCAHTQTQDPWIYLLIRVTGDFGVPHSHPGLMLRNIANLLRLKATFWELDSTSLLAYVF
jgi:hypothetical protein